MPATATCVGEDDFRSIVRDPSQDHLVLVVVAEGSAPVVRDLERTCVDRGGCFTMAIVSAPEALEATRRWNRSGRPAVCAFRDGACIASFDGAAIVAAVRGWLANALPREAMRCARLADRRAAADDPRALGEYEQALACDPGCPRALLGMARWQAAHGDRAGALALATRVPHSTGLGAEAAGLAELLRRREKAETSERRQRREALSSPKKD
jgi:thioredoxin-like negative regulator of GroEL